MSFYTFLPKLFNMSLTASVAIVLVILLRLLMKKAPKAISYALWVVVLFRLLCPVSIGSSLSLYNLFDAPAEESGTLTSVIEYVPSNIVHTEYPSVALPIPGISNVINEALPQGEEQLRADPLEGPIFLATYVWMTGVLVMALYSIVSYIQLRRKLSVIVPLRDNIFIADDIKSPFVVGLFRPKIYLPCNLGEKEQAYIILHEQHHIKRLDHIIKALAFLALAIHWFNPLVWLAFSLASMDMEMSCDEAVIRKIGGDVRADYSASLLTLATGRRIIAGTPLAFGEGDTKGRINNLSKWKKPAVWVVLTAVVVCILLAAGLLTNPITMGDHFVLVNHDSPANTNKLSYDIQLGKQAMSGEIYVEQWMDGTCVKSAPVVMTQYVESIEITMRDRRENGTSVGTDIQIETNQYGGSLLTYFAHPKNLTITGWGFGGYESNEKMKLTSNKEVILAAKVFDCGNGVRTFDSETLIAEPERIETAEYMIVVRAVFSEDPLGVTNQGETAFPVEVLTLNDVIILSQKGYDLTWSDFEEYHYIETGSGLYIRLYEINEQFHFAIGGAGPDSEPMYMYLGANGEDPNARIDIRDGGVTEFIQTHSKGAVTSSIADIVDPTKDENFACDTAMEMFFEDESNEYFFSGIYSQHVIVRYTDGTTETIAAALKNGKATIADLDKFGIRYWAEPKADPLDAAISAAILDHYRSDKPDGLIHVESHVLLANETMCGTPLLGADNHIEKVTAYLLVHHVKYSTFGGALEAVGGSYVPTAITFRISDSGEHILEEYWEPRDGSYYVKDVRDKFPGASADDALNDQAYIEELKAQNYHKAIVYLNNNIRLDVRIAELLDEIQSSPAHSSNPGDYIREHQAEYEELLGYGEYTLRYCFAEFLQGGQIDLRGHIMALACQDIADAFGEKEEPLENVVMTGQDWFDGFYSYAQVLAKNNSVEDLEKYYPATFLLLQLSNDTFATKDAPN